MWVSSFVFSISQFCKMEKTKVLNANNRNVEPIPDINTDSKPTKKKVRQSTLMMKISKTVKIAVLKVTED